VSYNELIYKTDVLNGEVVISAEFLKQAKDENQAVEFVTPLGSMYVLPSEIDIPDEINFFTLHHLKFDLTKSSLNPWEAKLLEVVDGSWFNLLRDVFNAPEFKDVLKEVKKIRDVKDVYPAKEDVFKPFSVPLDEFKTIVLGNSPKKQKEVFETGGLEKWGIFWLNISLTEDADSHKDIWRWFIEKVIDRMSIGVNWIITCNEAQYFKCFIKSEQVLELEVDPCKLVKLYSFL
jgi:uracil DNA glycosylase